MREELGIHVLIISLNFGQGVERGQLGMINETVGEQN